MKINHWSKTSQGCCFHGLSVSTCPVIATPHCKKEVSHYMEGGTMVISGAEVGYDVKGLTSYSCVASGGEVMWSPAPDIECPGT